MERVIKGLDGLRVINKSNAVAYQTKNVGKCMYRIHVTPPHRVLIQAQSTARQSTTRRSTQQVRVRELQARRYSTVWVIARKHSTDTITVLEKKMAEPRLLSCSLRFVIDGRIKARCGHS